VHCRTTLPARMAAVVDLTNRGGELREVENGLEYGGIRWILDRSDTGYANIHSGT